MTLPQDWLHSTQKEMRNDVVEMHGCSKLTQQSSEILNPTSQYTHDELCSLIWQNITHSQILLQGHFGIVGWACLIL